MLYVFLDKFFFIFHSCLILFNLFGWIWRKTRRLNLIVQLLTLFSWFVLGIWYGFGYCPCTDWHWQVRARLGTHDMPASYLAFLINQLTGIEVDKTLVDVFAVTFLLTALALSLYFNLKTGKSKSPYS
jgi:hypothetical protein